MPPKLFFGQPAGYLLTFLASFILSLALTPLVIRLARRFNFIDLPSRPHPAILHNHPVPKMSAVAMFLAFTISGFLFANWDKYLIGIWLASLINVVVGTIDEKYSLSPYLRLFIAQPLVAIIALLFGIGLVGYAVTSPLGGLIHLDQILIPINLLGQHHIVLWADLFVFFWIIMLMNMVNWSKGVSQLPGVSVIAFLTIAGVALKYQAGNPAQLQTATLCFILAGAALGFLPFGFPPEKMLFGYGGATFLGFNLAVLSVLSGSKLAAALLVLALPSADMVITILRRMLAGKNPLLGDRSHFYHLLLDFGLSKRQIIGLYWILTTFLGISALNLIGGSKLFAFVLSGLAVVVTFFILVKVLSSQRLRRLTPNLDK